MPTNKSIAAIYQRMNDKAKLEKGYGFIRGNNSKTYFIHKTYLNGEYIDADYYVFFRPCPMEYVMIRQEESIIQKFLWIKSLEGIILRENS